MISKQFLKSSLIYTLAGALPMASAIVLLPFYVNDLSTALYGKLSVFLAFSMLIQILVAYSFDSSVYVHFHEYKKNPDKLSAFISSAFVLILLIGLGVGLLFTITGEILFNLILKEKNISFFPYGLASVVTGIFQGVFKVNSSLLQTRGKPSVFLWANLLLFFLVALLTILGLRIFPDSLMGPIGGRMIASVVLGTWVLITIFKEFGIRFDFSWLKSSLNYNNYTFIYQIEQWIINYFDRILIVFFLPLTYVGVYDFAIKCLVIIELIMNGLHNTFFPKVIASIIDKNQRISTIEVNRYYNALVACVMILICLSIVGFPVLIRLFLDKSDYIGALEYLPYLAVLYLPRVVKIYFSVPYSAKKYTRPLPLIYLVVSAVKIGLMGLLITEYKIYGVIGASGVAAFVEVLLLRYSIRKRFEFRFNIYKILIAPFVLFAGIVFAESMFGTEYELTRHLGYLLLCLMMLWILYKNEILLLYESVMIKWSSR